MPRELCVLPCSIYPATTNTPIGQENIKAGTHEATNRSNMLLQQIALCVQSSDKSYALIAAIGCSDKSPGVNASTFGGKLIKFCRRDRILSLQHVAQNQTSLILCNMLQRQNSVAATKFSIKFSCSHDEICCCDVLQRFVVSCVPAFSDHNCGW